MSKVVSLRGGPIGGGDEPPNNESLIDALENLLKAARSGEFVGMAAVLLGSGEGVGYCFAGTLKYYTALGAMEEMKVEFGGLVDGMLEDGGSIH
jgi:hypothetical protein